MDDYMFKENVKLCKNVGEATTYLEIFYYSVRSPIWMGPFKVLANSVQDPHYNSVEEHPLTPDEFKNFLHQRVHIPITSHPRKFY